MNIDLKEYVKEYINDEIYFIQSQGYYNDASSKDLENLKNISDDKINKIANAIKNDDELYELLNELVHNYLYN